MMDWDKTTQILSHFRELRYTVSAIYAREEFLQKLLGQRPEAQIIRVISHDPRGGFEPIVLNGIPFIDEFGCQLYICSLVDWEGELTDLDERFIGTNLTANDL